MNTEVRSLETQRQEFAQRRFLAMPFAGIIMWTIIGIGGLFFPLEYETWLLFICTGFMAYLGIFISQFTGENFLEKNTLLVQYAIKKVVFMNKLTTKAKSKYTSDKKLNVYSLKIDYIK